MKELILRTIKREIERSTGCTDPGAVALAVSRARRILGARPERIQVEVSPNLYKNGVSVGIPGAGGRTGLALAAALGSFIDHWEEGLAILSRVTPALLSQADALTSQGLVSVASCPSPDPLFVRAVAYGGGHQAEVHIAGDYSAFTMAARDGQVLEQAEAAQAEQAHQRLTSYPVRQLQEAVLAMALPDLQFLLDYAAVNLAAAEAGLQDPSCCLSRRMQAGWDGAPGSRVAEAARRAQVMTAAAGEARMRGLPVPIMAIAGSGNHGITNFIGVAAAAEALGADPLATARALGLSSLLTVYTKEHIQRMTAFCGCAVAAAAGVAAAVTYLLGGGYEAEVLAIQTLIGTLGGMFCDGAKASCALKLSTASFLAVQYASWAVDGVGLPAGTGILGNTLEDTFFHLGRLNNPGMVRTDAEILQLIQRARGQRAGGAG